MAQRHVELLKNARNRMSKGYARWICHAVEDASVFDYCYPDHKTAEDIKNYIENVIYPHRDVGHWLTARGYSYTNYIDQNSINYRIRWIDYMIQNHEEFFGKD